MSKTPQGEDMLNLRTAGRSAKRYLPASVALWLKRVYHQKLLPRTYRRAALDDDQTARGLGLPSVPPPALRHRVHGEPDLGSFLRAGQKTLVHLKQGLQMAGRAPTDVRSALDFGCGCGRTLLWWLKEPVAPRLSAVDIDAESIAWVGRHVAVDARRSQPMPPLKFADGAFDLLYCISVFTHLDETFQDAWFGEFQRVVSPGGVLLISCHSAAANARLPSPVQARVERDGIFFYRDGVMNNVFPDFYQNTYHSDAYIRARWGSFFEIVGKVPMGMQDLIVMRRR